MATHVFRLMDLPSEIRDRIYHTSLCTWPSRPTDKERMKAGYAVVHDSFAYINPKPDIGILLANHQIYRDAVDVMLKGNRFVKLVLRGLHTRSVMVPKQVPVVCEGERAVNAFKGYLMTHTVEMADLRVFPPAYFMILGRDLELFCRALAGCGIERFGKESKHRVEIHNPFADTATPKYLDVRNQERLLQPYRQHLRGFASFKVEGNVQPGLAAAVAQEVKQETMQDPHDLLRELLEQKEVGKKYFSEGNTSMASETWAKCVLKLMRLARNSDMWERMKAETRKNTSTSTNTPTTDNNKDESWSNTITEIFFQLNSNLAMNTLRAMQLAEPTDPGLAGRYAGTLYNAVENASLASDTFGTSWRPSPEQEAKLAYRLAAAHRIARDDVDVAMHCIEGAAQRFPNDPAIRRERERIRQWAGVSGR